MINDTKRLLQAEIILTATATDKLKAISMAIQASTDGKGVTQASQAIEPVLTKLGLLTKKKMAFLRQNQLASLSEVLPQVKSRVEHQELADLLKKLTEQENVLQHELQKARNRLKRSKEFIDYNINVMTKASASTTYTPPGGAEVENRREIKMFDANV